MYSFSCIISSQIFVEKILHRMKIIYPLDIYRLYRLYRALYRAYITYLIVPFVDECYVYMYIISFYTTYDIILCVYIQKEFHKIVSIEQAICAFFTCIRVYVSRDS